MNFLHLMTGIDFLQFSYFNLYTFMNHGTEHICYHLRDVYNRQLRIVGVNNDSSSSGGGGVDGGNIIMVTLML